MKDLNFPTWSGPLAGVLIGTLVGLRAIPNSDVPLLFLAIGGALIGGMAGSFMLLLDRPKRQSTTKSSLVGKSIAVIGIPLALVPVIGFAFNIAGVVVNWRANDWPRITSIVAFGLSAIVLVPVIIIIVGAVLDPPP